MKSRFIGGLSGNLNIEEEYGILDEIERDIDFFEDEVEIDVEYYMRWHDEEEERIASIIASEPVMVV